MLFRSPRLGEHNEAVLTQVLGCSLDDVARLKTQGAFGTPKDPAAAQRHKAGETAPLV